MECPPDVKTVQKVVLEWIDVLLRRSGVDPSRIDGADQWVAFFLIVLLALALGAGGTVLPMVGGGLWRWMRCCVSCSCAG